MRLPRIWINFATAILLYLIVDILLGDIPNIKTFLLAFTGWTGIGNSSWYMFVIFSLYLIMFLSFLVMRFENITNKRWLTYLGTAIFTVLSVCLILILVVAGQRPHFYDTIPAFVMGGWYALIHEKVEKLVCSNDIVFATTCSVMLGIYLIGYQKRVSFIFYPIWEFAFVAGMLLLTMKVKITSRLLWWFGQHVFSIYILQRIPMNILSHFGIDNTYPYSFIVFSFVATIALALVFEHMMGKVKIFNSKS